MPVWPKVTIVTPSYNQGAYIEATIQSVLNQGYPNLEYLVMDGASTDGTVGILKKYGRRVRWVSEKDRGQTHAINKGLRRGRGEIVSYLNADDLLEDGALFIVAQAFQKNPEAQWLTARCRIVNHQGRKIRSSIETYRNFWLQHYSREKLLVLNFISQPATFWRRKLHGEVGYFNERLNFTMDYDLWLRISRSHKPLILPDTLASFRVHPSSKGGTRYREQFAEDWYVVRRHTSRPLLLTLHRIHNTMIVLAYRLLQ